MNRATLLDGFVVDCAEYDSSLDVESIRARAALAVRYYRAVAVERERIQYNQHLEKRWYDSLDAGEPDFGIYDGTEYMCDLYACWVVYSRTYLKSVESPSSLPPDGVVSNFGDVQTVADLGCGLGYTTEYLGGLFPGSRVYGTNLEGTKQIAFARMLGKRCGFVVCELDGVPRSDVVFASEYFEHFQSPIEHLEQVFDCIKPKVFVVANAFGTISPGHFREYMVGKYFVPGRNMSTIFNRSLVRLGYTKLKTKLWNNRPSCWVLGNRPKIGLGL